MKSRVSLALMLGLTLASCSQPNGTNSSTTGESVTVSPESPSQVTVSPTPIAPAPALSSPALSSPAPASPALSSPASPAPASPAPTTPVTSDPETEPDQPYRPIEPDDAIPAIPLPKADPNGDFRAKTSHRRWLVVDADSNGLNCRWSSNMPDEWYSPAATFSSNFRELPVVLQFQKGTILTSNITPAGFATISDDRNLPWLKVSIGPNDQICLVRANSQFIRPIE